MAMLGFYHNSSLFTYPVTSIHAGAWHIRQCEREREHVAGSREQRSTKTLQLTTGLNPDRLRGRQVLYPLGYAPWAGL